MSQYSLEQAVLYEDNHLLVVNKPAGLATMGTSPEIASLWHTAKEYLKRKYNKPGNVYLGVVSRLDALVTGVTLFAKTSKAAGRLSTQFRERHVSKRYWTLVPPQPRRAHERLVHWLMKDENQQRMVVVRPQTPQGQYAELVVETCGFAARWQWLEIELITGRKHQIRVQLAASGSPILGDQKYGSHERFPRGIALHAREITLRHPVRDEDLSVHAPIPSYWPKLSRVLPGDQDVE